jgi:hypothetical protein
MGGGLKGSSQRVGRNYFSAESMALIDAPRATEEVPPGLLIAS